MERFELRLPAFISLTGENGSRKILESVSRNVCSGGAFFELDRPPSIGTDIKINMILPLKGTDNSIGVTSRIDVSGSVIRTEPKGMAVCFEKKYSIMPLR